MPTIHLNREAIRTRFQMNMKRSGAIAAFLQSGVEELTPTGLFRSEGVRADMLRTLVVFLHATVEDFVRSHLSRRHNRFSLNSHADIENVLRKLNVDSSAFKDLYPPLTQLAKRRNQIVHYADLHDTQTEETTPWQLSDDWLLIQWNLAVLAFYHRFRRATGPTDMVEDRAQQNIESAMTTNVEFGRALIQISKLPPAEHADGLKTVVTLLDSLKDTLRLDVQMFLGPDGKLIKGPD